VTVSGEKKAPNLGVQFRISKTSLMRSAFFLPRRHRLQKLFSSFPDGWPGIGLIVLRIAVAFSAIAQGLIGLTTTSESSLSVWLTALVAVLVGLMVLVGFLTPFAGVAATIGYVITGVSLLLTGDASRQAQALTAVDLAVMSIALVLLGPGAFSLDARLFGRREIIIPDGRRSPM
jgi:uncharacterized membrane protein YphA (DoxX/SURF4 family)